MESLTFILIQLILKLQFAVQLTVKLDPYFGLMKNVYKLIIQLDFICAYLSGQISLFNIHDYKPLNNF